MRVFFEKTIFKTYTNMAKAATKSIATNLVLSRNTPE